jgi:hypothetical protein
MNKKTQIEILQDVLQELHAIKKGLPNGELAIIQKKLEDLDEGQTELRESIKTIRKRLFNPDDGIVVETNKNIEFRDGILDGKIELYDLKVQEFNNMLEWKKNIQRALWIIYSAILGVIIKLLFFQ